MADRNLPFDQLGKLSPEFSSSQHLMSDIQPSIRRPPGPEQPVVVSADAATLDVLENLRDSYGNMVSFTSPKGEQGYFVNDPDAVRSVLVRNHAKYVKGPGFEVVKLLLGNGLFVSDGETWRRSRTMVAPGFTRQNLRKLNDVILQCCEDRSQRWRQIALAGESLNITTEMSEYALEVILRAIFGVDYEARLIVDGKNPFAFLSEEPSRDLKMVLRLRELRKLVLEIIEERRQAGGTEHYDFLSVYLSAEDKDGGKYTDTELLDELMTLVIAGFETSAGTLNWAWYLIAGHPEVEEKLCEEAARLIPGAAAVAKQSIAELTYMQQVVEETMRLYPPGWLFSRRATADDRLGDYDVPAGTNIYISPYILQRTEQFWPEPGVFDPDRFAGGAEGKRQPAFVPFSLGPRRCIGEFLALLEIKVHLGLLLQEFHMQRVSDEQPELDLAVNLRSKKDIYLRPRLRHSA